MRAEGGARQRAGIDFLGSSAARRPFADYPKASTKTLVSKLSPELSATMIPAEH